jgi:hypothetical protein
VTLQAVVMAVVLELAVVVAVPQLVGMPEVAGILPIVVPQVVLVLSGILQVVVVEQQLAELRIGLGVHLAFFSYLLKKLFMMNVF